MRIIIMVAHFHGCFAHFTLCYSILCYFASLYVAISDHSDLLHYKFSTLQAGELVDTIMQT